MRILMIGSLLSPMRDDLITNSAGGFKFSPSTNRFIYPDGTEIWLVVIQKPSDVNRLRGLRFDLVVEHPSFRYEPYSMSEIRAIVLRPEPGRVNG